MCSAYYDRGTMIICGLESVNAKEPEDYFVVIVDHIKDLQRRFPRATIVVMPENNLGFEAAHIELLIRKQIFGRVVIMYEKDSVGFLTTHDTKTNMYAKFKNYLQKDAIRFDREVTAVNPECGWTRLRNDYLPEQLAQYSIITEVRVRPRARFDAAHSHGFFFLCSFSPHSCPSLRLDGSSRRTRAKSALAPKTMYVVRVRPSRLTANHSKTKRKPQALVVMQLNLLWYERFFTDPKYREYVSNSQTPKPND